MQAVLAFYLTALAAELMTVRTEKRPFTLDGADIMVHHLVHKCLLEQLFIPLVFLDILWTLCHPYAPTGVEPKLCRGNVQGEFTHFQLIIEVGGIVLLVLRLQQILCQLHYIFKNTNASPGRQF